MTHPSPNIMMDGNEFSLEPWKTKKQPEIDLGRLRRIAGLLNEEGWYTQSAYLESVIDLLEPRPYDECLREVKCFLTRSAAPQGWAS